MPRVPLLTRGSLGSLRAGEISIPGLFGLGNLGPHEVARSGLCGDDLVVLLHESCSHFAGFADEKFRWVEKAFISAGEVEAVFSGAKECTRAQR